MDENKNANVYIATMANSSQPRKRSRKGAPGILDVASRAGVSAATVSRCFNDPKVVRPDTRKRIEEAAEALGYIRDRVAGSLHNRMSGSVGLVVPTIDDAIFSELIEAFSAELHLHDRTMLIASHNYNLDREVTIIRSLLERRIDAVAIVGRDHSRVALEMLKVRKIPVVSLWNASGAGEIPCVGTDNRQGAAHVTQHLLDLGHRDFALIFPDTQNNDRARDRKQGVIKTLSTAGVAIRSAWDINCPYDGAIAKSIALDMFADERPTAIICGNDVIAHGVLHAAAKAKISVPDDLSVAGIGDFKSSAVIEPGLTTVRLPARRIGQIAARSLIDRSVSGDRDKVNDVLIPAELIVRASTGPV